MAHNPNLSVPTKVSHTFATCWSGEVSCSAAKPKKNKTSFQVIQPMVWERLHNFVLTISVTHTYWLTQFGVHSNTLQRQRKSTFKPLLWSKHAARTVAVRARDYGLIHHHTNSVCHRITRTQHTSTLTKHDHIWLIELNQSLSRLFLGPCYPFSRGIQQTLQVSVRAWLSASFCLNLSWILCDAMHTCKSEFGAHSEHWQDSL